MLHRLHGVLVYGANNFYMCKMPAGVGEKKLLHEARKKYGHFMHCTCLSRSLALSIARQQQLEF